ncbi:MAG: DHH family phosphoesterase [Selenomonadaceae bacterium]|nr:DHH family phosphoesterase [Selenomonadaceae bacterium]
MPRNLSAWPDSVINLAVMLVLIAVLIHYNKFLGACAVIVWALLIFFAYERRKCREKQFKEYCENVIGNVNDMMFYAMTQLPEGIVIVDGDGRLQWCNEVMQGFSAVTFQQGMYVAEFWDGLISDEILNLMPDGTEPAPEEGEYKVTARRHRETADGTIEEFDRHFLVKYRHLQANEDYPRMVVLFAHEITLYEELKVEYRQSRTALIYVQVDNYDEVTQGLNETEKTALMLSVSAILETWVAELSGFLRRVADDMFIVILERQALERAIEEKFTVLDKVRQLVNKKQIQVTLSMGAAVAEKNSSEQNISEVAEKAQAGLDLALGRGGDQVAVRMDDRTQFFGGRAKAVEKNTRVKARVMAKSIRDTMESSDVVFVMGHIREDYDAFGAAVGVALMAKKLGKPVYVVLSGWNDSIEKILKPFSKAEEYQGMFIREADISISSALEPMVVVVDTFIPKLVAVPSLLERVKKVIVIDHHRRSENTIKNTELTYLEPGSSSTCEMVTELLTYFDEKIRIGKLAATALYSGMVVDTKNFTVQTGSRTFEAAAYLRRSGADPVAVNHLFKSDYETTVALAKTEAESEYFEGGLVVSYIDRLIPNVQAVAGQAADSLLRVEGVRMTIILFQMKNGAVGISARSVGDLNVQVIMEKFGGGGHQNVAGAQVKNGKIFELRDSVTEIARAYIAESDKPIERAN